MDLNVEILAFTIINSVITVITVLGNTFALILFHQERRVLRPAHRYVVSLAIGDLMQGLVGIPSTIFMGFGAPLGSDLCVIICAIRNSICFTSLMNTLTASLDRLWAINFAIHYRKKVTGNVVNACIICSWLAAWIVGGQCFLFAFKPRNPDALCFEIRERFNPKYLTFLSVIFIPICAVIMVIAYGLMYRKWIKIIKPSINDISLKQIFKEILKKSDRSVLNNNKDIVDPSTNQKLREIKTTILMFSTVFLFFICWVPWPIVMNLIRRYNPTVNYTHVSMICYTFVSLNSMINPFLYVFHLGTWREAFWKLFKSFSCKSEKLEHSSGCSTSLE